MDAWGSNGQGANNTQQNGQWGNAQQQDWQNVNQTNDFGSQPQQGADWGSPQMQQSWDNQSQQQQGWSNPQQDNSQAQWGNQPQQSVGDKIGKTVDNAAQQASQAAKNGFKAFENSFDGGAVNLNFINETGTFGVKYLLYMFLACFCVATGSTTSLVILTCFVAFCEKKSEAAKILIVLCCTVIGFQFATDAVGALPDVITTPLSYLKGLLYNVKVLYVPLDFLYDIADFASSFIADIIIALRIVVAYKSFQSIKKGTFKIPKFVEKYM